MEYRRMGRWGLQLSALSFGTWITFGKQIDDSTADALLSMAYEAGINFFDNAEIYARGRSEEVMGKILKNKNWSRSSYCVSSKVFFGYEQGKPNQSGLSRKHIIEGCHAALKRLQLDYLDILFCHRPDKNTPIEETVMAMNTLIQQGKILYWGTSEWSVEEIMAAHAVARDYKITGPSVEQPQYNLFERTKMEKDYLLLFRDYGTGTTIWSPLASGLLSGKYLHSQDLSNTRLSIEGMEWLRERTLGDPKKIEKTRELKSLADELNVSLACLSIAWCLKNPHVSTVILGASRTEQLQENLKALEVLPLLDDSLMKKIDDLVQTRPVLPMY